MARTADAIGGAVRHGEPGVVEGCSSPIDDRRQVASEAGLGEASGEMIRIGCGVVFVGVARITISRRSGKISADVARSALRGGMFANQAEAHRGGVEGGAEPVRGRVA